MIQTAIYARYSSDQQREASIEDQVRLCRERAEREGWTVAAVYSDADTSKIKFPKGAGGKTIRHLRYTTQESWLVVRGADAGGFGQVMADVSQKILDSGHFAGRGFSAADDRIFWMSRELSGPGNATTWRELNTSHHIVRVLRDLGAMRGVEFPWHAFHDDPVQPSFFE